MAFTIAQAKKTVRPIKVELVNDIPMDVVEYIMDVYESNEIGKTLELIGSGTYGRVYALGEKYAIKVSVGSNTMSQMYSNDANILQKLSHIEAIPTLYAIIDNKCLIMERVNGAELDSYRHALNNPYNVTHQTLTEWDEALLQIIDAGYSPFDLHENNVMISKDGRVKIVDVGFFREHSLDSTEDYKYDKGWRDAQSWSGYTLKRYIKNVVEAQVAV